MNNIQNYSLYLICDSYRRNNLNRIEIVRNAGRSGELRGRDSEIGVRSSCKTISSR